MQDEWMDWQKTASQTNMTDCKEHMLIIWIKTKQSSIEATEQDTRLLAKANNNESHPCIITFAI